MKIEKLRYYGKEDDAKAKNGPQTPLYKILKGKNSKDRD